MEDEKTVVVDEETETKSLKNGPMAKGLKLVIGSAAAIGGGAVIGYLLRNQNYSGLKGLGKICAGIGISGLAAAAGNVAGEQLNKTVDDVCDVVEVVVQNSVTANAE